jgi:hypothetical protein
VSIDVGAPARGLIETLNPGGTWDAVTNARSGGTWPGTIQYGGAYQPTQPYDGPTPAIFCASIPLIANIRFAGAGCFQIDGTLELYYVDRLSVDQNVPLSVVDKTMVDNCTAVLNVILADRHLSDSVTSIGEPLAVIRDPEGIFREWAGAPWCWCSLRLPFISKIG